MNHKMLTVSGLTTQRKSARNISSNAEISQLQNTSIIHHPKQLSKCSVLAAISAKGYTTPPPDRAGKRERQAHTNSEDCNVTEGHLIPPKSKHFPRERDAECECETKGHHRKPAKTHISSTHRFAQTKEKASDVTHTPTHTHTTTRTSVVYNPKRGKMSVVSASSTHNTVFFGFLFGFCVGCRVSLRVFELLLGFLHFALAVLFPLLDVGLGEGDGCWGASEHFGVVGAAAG